MPELQVIGLQAEAVGPRGLRVRWEPPAGVVAALTYKVKCKSSNDEKGASVRGECEATLQLSPHCEYTVTVTAASSLGSLGDPVVITASTAEVCTRPSPALASGKAITGGGG